MRAVDEESVEIRVELLRVALEVELETRHGSPVWRRAFVPVHASRIVFATRPPDNLLTSATNATWGVRYPRSRGDTPRRVSQKDRSHVMGTISLRLPESLHKKVRELAKSENVSINQLITTALAEKMSALLTVDYLRERGALGDRAKYEAVLGEVRDVEPAEGDEWPCPTEESSSRRKR
ncbi:MAG: toxin-antitoxin system HicB family antitoxin [Actinomycetota bacterium]|nr:toxin-antitoxin system HicB family antitoxin [Actinomycetota bacterium]